MYGGAMTNLTKKELLRRIRKYEKESGNRSRISMKNKKQDMVDYLNEYKPEKKVSFIEEPVVIEIEGRTDAERKVRKKALKKIGKKKKEDKSIRNIRHKEIPTIKKYLEIKEHNLNLKGKKLKKKEPLKFVKGIDSKDKKKTLYNQKKWKKHKIKYNIVKKKDKVVLKIYEKERDVKKETVRKEYNFDSKKQFDKYRAEYQAKVELIKYMRKKITKS